MEGIKLKEYVINFLETVKHNRYIGHRLQGVLYKTQRDTLYSVTYIYVVFDGF